MAPEERGDVVGGASHPAQMGWLDLEQEVWLGFLQDRGRAEQRGVLRAFKIQLDEARGVFGLAA